MQVRLYSLIASTVLVLSACSTLKESVDKSAETSSKDESNFEDRLAEFTELALLSDQETASSDAELVSTKTCRKAVRERLDALVPISDERITASIAKHALFGLPQPANENELFLVQDEYVILYNSDLKIPMFATYKLRGQDVVKGERIQCFREDPRLPEGDRARLIDFDGDTGFARGHLVPDADMQLSADTAMNTYFMSNMMPQHTFVNSGSWVYLEAATRLWAKELGEVYVITGPIFDKDEDGQRDNEESATRAPPTFKVGKPSGFYRIVLNVAEDGDLRAISFIIPHLEVTTKPNPDYVPKKIETIDEIEAVTGYDFFAELQDPEERDLEAVKEEDFWCRKECNGQF